jgi:hypothetical protein
MDKRGCECIKSGDFSLARRLFFSITRVCISAFVNARMETRAAQVPTYCGLRSMGYSIMRGYASGS